MANDMKNMKNKLEKLEETANNPDAFKNLAEMIKKLDEKVEDYNGKTKSKIRELDRNVGDCMDEIAKLKNKIEDLQAALSALNNRMENLDVRFTTLKNMAGAGTSTNTSSGMDGKDAKALARDMRAEMEGLRKEIKAVKDDAYKAINEMNSEMQNKAGLDDLRDAENGLHDRIDGLEKSLQKAKNDLKRAIRLLDERVILPI